MLRQHWLVEKDTDSCLMVWLERDSRVKVGSQITLKELPDRTWTVMQIFELAIPRSDIKRGWNNNI